MRNWIIIIIVLIIIAGLFLIFDIGRKNVVPNNNATSTATTTIPEIILYSPVANQEVHSPFTITGKAKGNWYFEASFPIELVDMNGKVIFQTHADALTDWMTTDFVEFKAVINYPATSTGNALLILKNDNPSGDPIRDKSITIPVILK